MMKERIESFLKENTEHACELFYDEIQTDENADYRRGFRAGTFFAFLAIKADLAEILDDKNKD